jgi:hypothetical protein
MAIYAMRASIALGMATHRALPWIWNGDDVLEIMVRYRKVDSNQGLRLEISGLFYVRILRMMRGTGSGHGAGGCSLVEVFGSAGGCALSETWRRGDAGWRVWRTSGEGRGTWLCVFA